MNGEWDAQDKGFHQ